MNINTKSFHYKIYAWWNNFYYDEVPIQTNLCNYVKTLIVWIPLSLLLASVILPIYFLGRLVQTIILISVGQLPEKIFDPDIEITKSYAGLRIGNVELYPVHFIIGLIGLGIAGLVFFVLKWKLGLAFTLGSVCGVVLLIGLILLFTNHPELTRLTKVYYQSFKKSVCPIVTFSKEPTDEKI